MIQIKTLDYSYHSVSNTFKGLIGINFEDKEREFLSSQNLPGSRKSTPLSLIGRLDVTDSGVYSLDKLYLKNLKAKVAAMYPNKVESSPREQRQYTPISRALVNEPNAGWQLVLKWWGIATLYEDLESTANTSK